MTADEFREKAKEARDMAARARRLAHALDSADRARLEQYAKEMEEHAAHYEAQASRMSKIGRAHV